MLRTSRSLLAAAAIATLAGSAHAQRVVSAKAGLVHYTEGDVRLRDQLVVIKTGEFPEMKGGDVLAAGLGRAEVLLTPGTTLRLAENSSFKLLTTALEDVNLELLSGSLLLEVAEPEKHTSVTLKVHDASLAIDKRGVYRIDFNPAQVRVYEGAVEIMMAGKSLTLKEGKRVMLDRDLVAERFDKNKGDAFHRWAGRRSGYLAVANMASARSLYNVAGHSGSWYYNPFFGLFTYIPYRNFTSLWGYRYFAPGFHMPSIETGPGSNSGAWYPRAEIGSGNSPGVYSGGSGARSAPPQSSAPAAPAAPPRSADSGSSRGSSGGR